MEQEQNRVLKLEDLISAGVGTPVYVETTPELPTAMVMSTPWHTRNTKDGAPVLTSMVIPWHRLPLTGHTFYGELWRAWLREPTPAELAAHPWPNEKEES